MKRILLVLATLTLAAAACGLPAQATLPPDSAIATASPTIPPPASTATTPIQPTPTTVQPTATASPEPTATEPALPQAVGPETFPEGINPLTGLPVENPDNLLLPPALVSITNFPISARPQAGLSFSPWVFELYITEGMTRLLALFYGDFPATSLPGNGTVEEPSSVGPIRSGRISYESLRKQYSGFLVMASASQGVVENLSDYANIFGSDSDSINSAMIPVERLAEIAAANQDRLGESALSGLRFDTEIPEGGLSGRKLWLPYSFMNQILWVHNPDAGGYHRWQDEADGETFTMATDRLTGEPLVFENVVILFVNHRVIKPTIIDLDLSFMDHQPALLLRDGKLYEVFWSTRNEAYELNTGRMRPIRFYDADGNPFPLKPGQTWVEMVPLYTPYYEIPDSEDYYQRTHLEEPGSGVWAVRFRPPAGAK